VTFLEQLASGSDGSSLLILAALPIVAALLLVLLAFSPDSKKALKRRVKRVRGEHVPSHDMPRTVSVRRSTTDSNFAVLDQMIKRSLPRRDELRRRIARAGLKLSLQNYLLICLVIGLAGAGGTHLTGFAPPIASLSAGLVCGFGLPHMLTAMLARRRKAKFIANFPEAIDLMTRGIKSGLPIGESIKAAAVEIPDPVGSELTAVMDAVRLGTKLEDALLEASERLDLQEFKFFVISLSIQAETGGNLAETLANLSDVLRKRRQLKLKIRALSSEAKASAYIIGSLPFVMALMIYMMSPNYIMKLVHDPRGLIMIGIGFCSFAVGTAVMIKMIRFDH